MPPNPSSHGAGESSPCHGAGLHTDEGHRVAGGAAPATLQDPVCGMTVAADGPRRVEHRGKAYVFCSDRCRERFVATPENFLGDRPRADAAPAEVPAGTVYICSMCPEVRESQPVSCPSCGMALEPELPATLNQSAQWICPMHPEVVADGPGDCPECGMALEAQRGAAEEDNPELIDMRRRLWVAALLCVPLLVVSMGDMVLPGSPVGSFLRGLLGADGPRLLEWVLATPVCLWAGWPFLVRAVRSLISRNLNMFTLIGLGVSVAYVYSAIAVLFPQWFPPSFRLPAADGAAGMGHVAVYFEASAVIVTLVIVGQVLELSARGRTTAALRALIDLAPIVAHRIESRASGSCHSHHDDRAQSANPGTNQIDGDGDGDSGGEDGEIEVDIGLDRVVVGDRLRVRPGEKIPVDGTVLTGTSAINESMVTGEPIPAVRGPGDSIIGGTINGAGSLVMRADRVGDDTLLARIVALVAEAQRSRAPVQRLADVVAGYFVPTVVLVAVLAFAAWAMWGPEPRMVYALVNAVAVLIIACPCALGLATPMSITVAMGRGAGLGVLFRSAEAIETLGQVDTMVVDKTGTLTEGKPELAEVYVDPGSGIEIDEDTLLGLVAAVERGSEHPLARAIVSGAIARQEGKGAQPASSVYADVEDFIALPGRGVRGRVQGREVVVGNRALMSDMALDIDGLAPVAEDRRAMGQTVVYVAIDGALCGFIGIADPVKDSAAETLRQLEQEGVRVIMLTGDSRSTAMAVADALAIDEVHAEVLPEGKAALIERLQREGHLVAMAGDGVNDAPALAQATVGIAMGNGTDVAMESAGVTLVKGDLRGIARARRLSRATMGNIRQNLFFAFIYNAAGVPIAAGILYPVMGLLLNPMIAAAAMSLSSVSVIGNALRLRRAQV